MTKEKENNILDERTKQSFLTYANSVIKSRAIPSVEDNLKPIHRKILWTMYEDKLFPDKKTTKSASVVGDAMHYSPHGDSSIYGALVRMSQWWKLRYPLITMQGNCGNLLGDSAAASRYTECKLSSIGMLMLEDMNKNCVQMKPNYSGEQEEPVTLPSKFPFLLCGNNSGIAVGMSSDLVSHNFTEVSEGIKYYLDHKDCTIADLMTYIKGPDFPTGGKIINGEELLNIYTIGHGAVKVAAHYDIKKSGQKTLIIFHDLPYGVEIDSGVKAPLKKLVLDDGYDVFEDITVEKVGSRNFDITITLAKNADVAKCLEILFTKTRLCESVKINQTVIVDNEPKLMNLKQLVAYWVDYRSSIIKNIAQTDYDKTNHKLTITLGLQKCMSDIDKLIQLIRGADSRAAAKVSIIKEFSLNDEQAEAVLDIKLSKLSKLDLTELNDDQQSLEKTLAQLKTIIDDENVRYEQIKRDLDSIKKLIGKDERLTEIHYSAPVKDLKTDKPVVKEQYLIFKDGLHQTDLSIMENTLVDIVSAYAVKDIYGYNKEGEMMPITNLNADLIGGLVKEGNKVVAVTKNGNVKVSNIEGYYWTKNNEKLIKVKEDDCLIYAACCSDNDYLMLLGDNNNLLKLAIKDLPTATKNTVGVKSGLTTILAATIAQDSDLLLFVTKDNKGKFTPVKDFKENRKGNSGQLVADGTCFMRRFSSDRTCFYIIPQSGRVITVEKNKITTKSRTAIGANITTKKISLIV